MTQRMNWVQLLSTKRLGVAEKIHNENETRTAFHKDYDRLIFSTAFRRLGRKTQVHPLAIHDHVHNRMTHSLEVSAVGRSLGYQIGKKIEHLLPDYVSAHDIAMIVQSASLAHDFGNPPFGHGGENAVRAWFAQTENNHYLNDLSLSQQMDFLTFEGNAQCFRLVTTQNAEQPLGGMRLTYATLGALVKYPWYSGYNKYPKKYGYNQTEKEFFREMADTLGLIEKEKGVWCRHPLSLLMEAADDCCYAIIDLEDAVDLSILEQSTVVSVFEPLGLTDTERLFLPALRGLIMDKAVEAICNAFMDNYEAIMTGDFKGSLLEVTSNPVALVIKNAKKLAKVAVYDANPENNYREKTNTILSVLLNDLIPAVKPAWNGEFTESLLLKTVFKDISKAETLGEAYAVAMDYISGMTDNFALSCFNEISKKTNSYGFNVVL